LHAVKRILIASTDVKFGLTAKKGLEQTGEFEVTVFSNGSSAVDFVRQNPQDLVLIDFRIKDMPGTDMIDHMRAMRPDIAVLAAPDHPAVHNLKNRYNIQEVISIPIRLRQLVAVIHDALKAMDNEPSDTAQSPSINTTDTTRMEPPSILEFWLADADDGDTIVERTPTGDEPKPDIEVSATFQRLAEEEPPMPAFEDASTIRDLRDKLRNINQIQRVLQKNDTEPIDADEEVNPDTRSIPAALILETALDDSTPRRNFSLQTFMTQVTERGLPEIEPLPSWLQESERYIREPDFLAEQMQQLTGIVEYTASVTLQGSPQLIEEDPGNLVTDPIEPVLRSRPIEEIEPAIAEQIAEIDAHALDFEAIKRPPMPELAPLARAVPPTIPELPFTEYDDSDPQLAQLATTLTQVALELTADATVLARNGKIVAYAGKLPPSDIEDLHEHLTVKWDMKDESDKSRILFATLPNSGTEYMISTRGTEDGFTLSLIFSGTRPLHDIRRQSKRLAEALAVIPEIEPEPIPEPEPPKPLISIPSTDEIGVRLPITFLWLLRDSEAEIPGRIQQAIIKTMDVELTQDGWKIEDIHAPDYIYLQAYMPASLNPRKMLRDLMNRIAVIIHDQYPHLADEKLWHDSYLILQPGREMQTEEIQRFIHFARR
jgi:CheY-like chemotaxis protein